MFDKEFFPTPSHVIDIMIGDLDLNNKVVLEPSSGKGDIIRACVNKGAKVIACEKNKQLAELSSNDAEMIGTNFFDITKQQVSHVDYIIMNPPFSNADSHILHAYEIAPENCTIISLCNYDTIRNDYSRQRRSLTTLIKNAGASINLGNVFSDAERTTNVNIGLVTLYTPQGDDFDISGFFDMSEDNEMQENGLIPYNAIRDIVNRYASGMKLYDEVSDIGVRMNDLLSMFGTKNYSFICSEENKKVNRNSFRKEMQKLAWRCVFDKLDMRSRVTNSLYEQLNTFVEKNHNIPFTMKNVYKMIEMIAGTHENRMNKALVDAFDSMTKHTHENRYNVEGWKTNSSYMINKKIIIHQGAELSWSGKIEVNSWSYSGQRLEDLIKALCYLMAITYNSDMQPSSVAREYESNTWYDSYFFEFKVFKKGTMHLKFKDLNVWEKLNRKVAELKGYSLPEKF